jgi:hypothetical protein
MDTNNSLSRRQFVVGAAAAAGGAFLGQTGPRGISTKHTYEH